MGGQAMMMGRTRRWVYQAIEGQRDRAAALPQLQQKLEFAREVVESVGECYGEAHLDFARRLHDLAELYQAMGDYAAALPLLRQALEIRRTALGEAHPDFADSLNSVAVVFQVTGDYAAALPLHQQALEIYRVSLGEADPDFAVSLTCMALVYKAMGDYARAEPLFRQALGITRAALGTAHPDYAGSLNNLAALYQDTEDYAQAERLFRQALKARRAALGTAHPDYAGSLNNLALLYWSTEDYARAEPLFRQAVEVTRAALGEAHPAFATSLNNLALLYWSTEDYAQAERLFRQALEIRRTALGEAHPDYARSLNNLALVYRDTGDYARAEPLFRLALDIIRAALGEAHPFDTRALINLAELCAAGHRTAEAFALLSQAADSDDHMIGQLFSFASDRQRAAYLRRTQTNMALLLSLVASCSVESTECVRAALEVVLRRKAVRGEADAVRRSALLGCQYPHLRPQLHKLDTLAFQIARRTLAGPGPERVETHRRLLSQWEEESEELERELARQIPEMNLWQRLRAADSRAVARALPHGVALVEFVCYDVFDFQARLDRGEPQWKPARYAAFVLPQGEPDGVRMVDLGEVAFIDALIEDFRRATFAHGPSSRDLQLLPLGTQVAAGPGDRLREAVFDPLAQALRDRARLLLSPEGMLAWLPFGVLPAADGRLLMDHYRISYVGSGRDSLRFTTDPGTTHTAPLVVCDPNFDLGSDAPTDPNRVPVGTWSRDLPRGRFHFAALPGTRAEGVAVAARLGVPPCRGADALEGWLKGVCQSPRVFHLATHGFFLPDQPPQSKRLDRNLEWSNLGSPDRLSGPPPENPLLRSGLALAGANTFLRGGTPPEGAEDGLLTALDVTGLDLRGTDLVVLSACNTGMGDVQIGEGVMGLRRAFTLAGARTLVMSLWEVPDLATAFLMDRLYDNLLAHGLDRDLALSEAQKAARDVTVGRLRGDWLSDAVIERLASGDAGARRVLEELARQPDDHRPFEHPFYWGAFICQGDTSPLPAVGKGTQ
jgi:tetratricopeptide (TPR) repeat protein